MLWLGTLWNVAKRDHALLSTMFYHETFTRCTGAQGLDVLRQASTTPVLHRTADGSVGGECGASASRSGLAPEAVHSHPGSIQAAQALEGDMFVSVLVRSTSSQGCCPDFWSFPSSAAW